MYKRALTASEIQAIYVVAMAENVSVAAQTRKGASRRGTPSFVIKAAMCQLKVGPIQISATLPN